MSLVCSADSAWAWSELGAEGSDFFGPQSVTVDEGLVRRHAYTHDAGEGRVLLSTGEVSPLVLGGHLLRVYEERHQRHAEVGGLHVRESLSLASPVWLGETVTVSGRFTGWYERKGRCCLVLDAEARGRDGRLVARARATELLPEVPPLVERRPPMPGLARQVSPSTDDRPRASSVRRDLEVGVLLPTVAHHLDQGRISLYSGASTFERNLHTDPAAAAARGYPRPVAQGMHLCGLVDELCLGFYGARWWSVGTFDARFVAPVLAGATVRSTGRVAAVRRRADDTAVVDLDLWASDGDRVVLVGTASAVV